MAGSIDLDKNLKNGSRMGDDAHFLFDKRFFSKIRLCYFCDNNVLDIHAKN